MNLLDKTSEKVTRYPLLGIRALIAAIALHTVSCVSSQNTQYPINQAVQKSDVSE